MHEYQYSYETCSPYVTTMSRIRYEELNVKYWSPSSHCIRTYS